MDRNKKDRSWKTLILLCLAVYPTLNIVGLVFSPLVGGWQMWQATLVTLPVTMVIVNYFVLPFFMRLFARWLSD